MDDPAEGEVLSAALRALCSWEKDCAFADTGKLRGSLAEEQRHANYQQLGL